jgi:hypothetical protein
MSLRAKDCFGILDKVFPMGEEGLREVDPACLDCPDRKSCLQTALLTEDGIDFRNEILDRAVAKGLIGPFERWSEKKRIFQSSKYKKGSTE